MIVLVATPCRMSAKPAFVARSQALYDALTYADKERVVLRNAIGVQGLGKYAANAIARNTLIDFYLKPHHTHVLWVDVDIVDYPSDLIERLLSTGGRYGAAAPFVLIEGTDRFYDYGGFVRNGACFSPTPPYTDAEGLAAGLMEMDSVGSVYLMPAYYYTAGCRYAPDGDEVEHRSLFRQARDSGCRVFADSHITAYHANLPLWGEEWH